MALVALVLSLFNTSLWCLTIGAVLRKRAQTQKMIENFKKGKK